MNDAHTVLIVGASRGLGWGLARAYLHRGWHVIATIRPGATDTPLHALQQEFPALDIETVDVTEPRQIEALANRCTARAIDLLFVNAGVTNDPEQQVGDVDTAEFMRVMLTNALAPLRIVERMADMVRERGTIAVMSSELGSVTDNTHGGWEVYRASKAALNTLMRSFVARRRDDKRSYFVVAPGWTRTDMGGAEAPLDIETSIGGVVRTLERRRGSGGLAFVNYRDEELPW